MSEWYRIKDPDDVSLNEDTETLDVLFDYNNFGNVYIEIPLDFVTKTIKTYMHKELMELADNLAVQRKD
jgi:hypothetical protein